MPWISNSYSAKLCANVPRPWRSPVSMPTPASCWGRRVGRSRSGDACRRLPSRRRSYDEARELVQQRWYGEEGERLMRALVEKLRGEMGVTRNDAAIQRAVQSGGGAVKKT